MEDNDTQRSQPEYASRIMEDMEWLGLTWDEGPFYQSQRTERYQHALEQLTEAGRTYPCFCSRKDLQTLASAPHGLHSEGPDYPGFCRDLSPEEQRARTSEKDPAIRFILPHKSYSFNDLILGEQQFEPGWGGDFVIRRADQMWAYQLACTVDDIEMGITHVTRGSDLVDSTPRQLALMDVLGAQPPRYAHTPLWMGTDGHRLSKRHGDVSLRDFRAAGKTPEHMLGWFAFHSGLTSAMSALDLDELLERFNLSAIGKEPVVVKL